MLIAISNTTKAPGVSIQIIMDKEHDDHSTCQLPVGEGVFFPSFQADEP